MNRLLIVCAAALALAGIAAAQAPNAQRPDPRSVRLRGNRFKPLTENSGMGINVRHDSHGHIIVGNVFLPVNGFDEFLVSTDGATVNALLFHSNLGGAVYEDTDNLGAKKLNLSELHTVVTRAAAPFAAADLGPGQVGFRQDTGELFFNLPGGVRKVATTT